MLLQHLQELIPTLPSTLLPHLLKHFPHRRLSKNCQITYIRNLLRVSTYCSSLTERILTVIVERAIQIDVRLLILPARNCLTIASQVEIQVEFEELEVAEEDNLDTDGAVFDLDPFDIDATQPEDLSDDNGSDDDILDNLSDLSSEAEGALSDEDDKKPKAHQVDIPHIRDMVEKLDCIMKILFEYFSETPRSLSSNALSEDEKLPSPDEEVIKAHRTSLFHAILSIFDKVILRTLKSKCIQFLVFWYTSLDAQYLDIFQGMLISKAFIEIDTPLVIRVAATSYIASFVSRANFVNKDHTRHIVRLFRQHLEDQLEISYVDNSTRPNASQYTTFYAVAQALFLIFCFRWRDLIDNVGENGEAVGGFSISKKWIQDLEIVSKIVNSFLNPLRVCGIDARFASSALIGL